MVGPLPILKKVSGSCPDTLIVVDFIIKFGRKMVGSLGNPGMISQIYPSNLGHVSPCFTNCPMPFLLPARFLRLQSHHGLLR